MRNGPAFRSQRFWIGRGSPARPVTLYWKEPIGASQWSPPTPPEPISYSRSVPLDKALDDVLIAYAMTGADLPLDHGFPMRASVPGHYGMASVKWLTHVHGRAAQCHGHWHTSDYSSSAEAAGTP